MRPKLLVNSLLILSLSFEAQAWTKKTQEWFADEVCKEFKECNNKYNELVKEYSMYPDRWYIYPFTYPYHLNYYTEGGCPSGPWKCPDFYDQASLEKTAKLLEEAYQKEGAEKWKLIAQAGHYYVESEEFWHKVNREDFFHCHNKMEKEFDKNFREGKTDFEVCVCDICESTSQLKKKKEEFVDFLKGSSYPQNYRMDDASFFKRFLRMLGDWF